MSRYWWMEMDSIAEVPFTTEKPELTLAAIANSLNFLRAHYTWNTFYYVGHKGSISLNTSCEFVK